MTAEQADIEWQGYHDDGKVLAYLSVFPQCVQISEWSSREPGQCHTNRALEAIRQQYQRAIWALGIGSDPGDPSWQYWLHQYERGRVDALYDDEGIPVAAPPDG